LRPSEQLLDPAEEPFPNRCAVAGAEIRAALLALLRAVEQEPHRGGMLRALHHVGKAADSARRAAPHRKTEDLLRQLGHSAQAGAAAGEPRAARQQLL